MSKKNRQRLIQLFALIGIIGIVLSSLVGVIPYLQ